MTKKSKNEIMDALHFPPLFFYPLTLYTPTKYAYKELRLDF